MKKNIAFIPHFSLAGKECQTETILLTTARAIYVEWYCLTLHLHITMVFIEAV
jgi:hypothetical protein